MIFYYKKIDRPTTTDSSYRKAKVSCLYLLTVNNNNGFTVKWACARCQTSRLGKEKNQPQGLISHWAGSKGICMISCQEVVSCCPQSVLANLFCHSNRWNSEGGIFALFFSPTHLLLPSDHLTHFFQLSTSATPRDARLSKVCMVTGTRPGVTETDLGQNLAFQSMPLPLCYHPNQQTALTSDNAREATTTRGSLQVELKLSSFPLTVTQSLSTNLFYLTCFLSHINIY